MPLLKKIPQITRSVCLIICAAATFSSCEFINDLTGRTTPLDALVTKLMSEGNFRDFDHHTYSLFYTAIPPNTIEIHVKYARATDLQEINRVVSSFEEMARKVAKQSFEIERLNFLVDMKEEKKQ